MAESKQSVVGGGVETCNDWHSIDGWIAVTDDPQPDTRIELWIGETLIGSATAAVKRDDGTLGFQILYHDTQLAVVPRQSRIRVVARPSHRAPFELALSSTLIERLQRTIAYAQSATLGAPGEKPVTQCLIPAGTASPDGSVVLGGDGYVFLYRGSNDVASLYAAPRDSRLNERKAAWIGMFSRREEFLAERNIAHIQIIIPEKSTILSKVAPAGLQPVTPLLALVEEWAGQEQNLPRGPYYVSVMEPLRTLSLMGWPPFLRTDTHLSSYGSSEIFQQVLARLAMHNDLDGPGIREMLHLLKALQPKTETKQLSGDVSERFPGMKMYERIRELEAATIAAFGNEITMSEIFVPPDGKHQGRYIAWTNKNAPIKKKVIAFANSFFEQGQQQRMLSWWFKHAFQEFHFIWTSEMRRELILQEKPDIVVCQTIERFLNSMPCG